MKKLFSISNLIIGITLVILGIRWIIVDEPWMLDKVANEERLGMTFDKLFENEINQTLPNYLKQIYRFFGLWVLIIGFFILGLSRVDLSTNSKIRLLILSCVGIMSYLGLGLAIFWIPSSPFIYLGCAMVLLHVVSFYAHINY
mgnify:FL=1